MRGRTYSPAPSAVNVDVLGGVFFGGDGGRERGNGGGDLAGFKSDGNKRNVTGGY